ncbi:TPA: potassium voltage-gated channel, subfamily G, member 2-like [Bos taurus]|nr:TPA: potassium voltage-gated channel, subfamily G, member 2-like [Bos taurus]
MTKKKPSLPRRNRWKGIELGHSLESAESKPVTTRRPRDSRASHPGPAAKPPTASAWSPPGFTDGAPPLLVQPCPSEPVQRGRTVAETHPASEGPASRRRVGCQGVSSEVVITEPVELLSEQLRRRPGDLRCWPSPDLQGPQCPRQNLVLEPGLQPFVSGGDTLVHTTPAPTAPPETAEGGRGGGRDSFPFPFAEVSVAPSRTKVCSKTQCLQEGDLSSQGQRSPNIGGGPPPTKDEPDAGKPAGGQPPWSLDPEIWRGFSSFQGAGRSSSTKVPSFGSIRDFHTYIPAVLSALGWVSCACTVWSHGTLAFFPPDASGELSYLVMTPKIIPGLPDAPGGRAQPPDPGAAHGAMALLPGPAERRGGGGGARARHVIINVGGCRVRLAWAALARCPLARLERLRTCRGHDELLRVCDDYDVSRDEFFFDRSPCAFRPGGRLARGRRRLRDVVDDPRSGPAGKLFACVSVAFVAVTAVGLCLSTMPDIRAEEERGECSPKCRNLFVLETVCVAWFSFEFLLRSLQAESKCAFLRTPLNIIDILAILPFYVSLLVGLAARPGAGGNKLLERAGLVLRLLRALRVLYVMRLARHSLGLRSLGLTVRRCAREFGLLLLFLCVAMALFAPLVHLAERELGARRDFSSVPASYWWAVISMTTVGYGDMVPRSLPGQVVALSSILSGILLMAFPVTSIFHTFSRSYSELKEQQQRAASPEPALREDSTRSASASATATEDDGSQSPDGAGSAGASAEGPWAPAGPT